MQAKISPSNLVRLRLLHGLKAMLPLLSEPTTRAVFQLVPLSTQLSSRVNNSNSRMANNNLLLSHPRHLNLEEILSKLQRHSA